ncbi:thioredoxin-1-like protein [Dinothrombium tinctorium]|uniref:Thioredoxin n=1 Tax=Dinothrombium tinctorium TaxID=1965070 RepID=A0A3S3QB26_9ACAR|nr:thioredoxin-1-like protein [Dinothrombium tinctorium]
MKVHLVKDQADFNAKLEEAGSKLVVVDFFATWCGPCKAIAPCIEKLAEQLKDSVVFLKVDVDENESIATEYKITAMPTFKFFKNKTEIDEFSGANEKKLTELIEKHK